MAPMDLVKLRNQLIEHEEWRPIAGFSDYMVSSSGMVRSVTKRKGGRANVNGGLVKGWIAKSRSGKPVAIKVALRLEGKTYERRVHRLVAEAFIGPKPKPDFEVCHNDGNPLHNHFSNLRWDSHLNNVKDCIKHGTKTSPPYHLPGDSHPKAKITINQKKEIASFLPRRGLHAELARKYGVSQTHIGRIRKEFIYGSH
jgi:hypothetical protein